MGAESDPELPAVLRGEKGDPGPRGPQGPPGGRLFKHAASVLAAGRVVCVLDDGDHIDLASARLAATARVILGVTATAAQVVEQEVEVVCQGELSNAGWAFLPQRNVFVGDNGVLTQTIDSSWSFVCVVGRALSPTKLMVDVQAPVFLAPA